MRLTVKQLAVDGWALCRRDGDLLLRIAAPFLFLPVLARALLVPPFPMPVTTGPVDRATLTADSPAMQAWSGAVNAWVGRYGLVEIAAALMTLYGALALLSFYCDGRGVTVGAALRRALRLTPRYLLVVLIVAVPLAPAGLLALVAPPTLALTIVPILYIQARVILAGPLIIAEAPIGAFAAVVRSWRRTRGNGLALTAVLGLVTLGAQLVASVLVAADTGLKASGMGNPVVLAIIDAAAATVSMLGGIALALVAVVAYRRLAR